MPRSPRLILPDVPMHLIQRGHARAPTFRCADDFRRYRETLFHAIRQFGCAIHAYVLMTNHVHLLLTPEDARGPARVMQAIGRRYVRYSNVRYGRTGAWWEGRFRSSVIHSERYLFVCSRYIELNPVRAGMVDQPEEYRWSSFRSNAYGEADDLITRHPLYDALGSSDHERQAAYRALFRTPIETGVLERIRRAISRGNGIDDNLFATT